LVEQSIRNRQVIGSSPIVGSISLSLRSKPPGNFVSLKFAFAPVARRSARGRPRGDPGDPGDPAITAILFNLALTKPFRFPHFAAI
jgi:hypothetical protein